MSQASGLVNTDIKAKRNEFYFCPPKFIDDILRRACKDERDMPLIYLFFNITCLTLPGAAVVFYLGTNTAGAIYFLINLFTFQERFTLGLHFASHRSLFRSRVLNGWAPYVLSPFFGIPSGIYFIHHCVMHHVENNVFPWDVSSTEPYQRDNFLHFLHYWMRFLLAIWVELPYYAWKRGRKGLAVYGACCVLGFMVAIYFLYQANSIATFWVFLLPTFVCSLLLMFGNWSQHIFVDPKKPDCNYHLTYNIINTPLNQKTFNDGYHLEHHVQSRRHWSELPESFMKNLDKYAQEDCVVFSGLDFMAVGMLVILRQYKVLANRFVQLKSPPLNPTQIETLLRSRLVPIHRKQQ